MRNRAFGICVLSVFLLAGVCATQVVRVQGAAHPAPQNMQAAAKYLDDRQTWWQNWPKK